MIQKICPYCDQVVRNGLYCESCRSRIRASKLQKIDFYLNQRHPADDADCSYHEALYDVPEIYGGTGGVSGGKKRWSMPERRTEAEMPRAQKKKEAQKRKGGFKGALTLIGWIIIMSGIMKACGN